VFLEVKLGFSILTLHLRPRLEITKKTRYTKMVRGVKKKGWF
jgi:hypothetical protein